MASILIAGIVIVVLCFFPIMLVARALNTGKSDLLDCIFALLVGSSISNIVVPFLPGARDDIVLASLYSFLVVGAVYKHMLDTTYVKGVIIALIPAIGWALADTVIPAA